MAGFETWFVHKGMYLLPDGTRVVAFWTTLGNDPRWWFLTEQNEIPGRLGEMQLVVYPNGSVYNFVPEMDGLYPALYHPCPSEPISAALFTRCAHSHAPGGTPLM